MLEIKRYQRFVMRRGIFWGERSCFQRLESKKLHPLVRLKSPSWNEPDPTLVQSYSALAQRPPLSLQQISDPF